jgi:hypothetical protein
MPAADSTIKPPACVGSASLGEEGRRIKWWAMLGLNQRPLPCEGSALPLSYAPIKAANKANSYAFSKLVLNDAIPA